MYLVRLIYASRVSDGFNEESIEDILVAAREHNTRLDVSGLLCFSHDIFLQCLEGGRSSVNEIYMKILNDPRHSEAVLLGYEEIYERDFAHWSMGYVTNNAMTHEINMRYSRSGNFNPYEMSGESAHRLLIEMSNNVPVV